MKTVAQKLRIIENIYDIITETEFAEEAKKEMKKDIKNKNILLDYEKGTIEIQIKPNLRTQYTITIS